MFNFLIDKDELYNSCLIWLKRIKSSIKVFEDTLVKVTRPTFEDFTLRCRLFFVF